MVIKKTLCNASTKVSEDVWPTITKERAIEIIEKAFVTGKYVSVSPEEPAAAEYLGLFHPQEWCELVCRYEDAGLGDHTGYVVTMEDIRLAMETAARGSRWMPTASHRRIM